jgi:hypothetical protein
MFSKLQYNAVFFVYIFWRARVFGHSFAYVAHFVFLRDVWIRTHRAVVASRRPTNLDTHLPCLAIHLPDLGNHLPQLSHTSTSLSHLSP